MHSRNMHLWLPGYLKRSMSRFLHTNHHNHRHVLFCFVDHFEPHDSRRTQQENDRIMGQWIERYPQLCRKHEDSDGVPPQHTWFYPAEAYHREYLDGLGKLAQQRLGEIELHLHHGNDDEASLRVLIERAKKDFGRHGALITTESPPRFAYGFIHGNSALCNSRSDSGWCGVNDELRVLREAGCYADFSFPTYPSESQPRTLNSIYYASSSPDRPRGHDKGARMAVGVRPQGDLLLIQGPLALNWKRRKYALLPRVEAGDITGSNPATSQRIRLWVRQGISVEGRPEWIFVKVSCHGASAGDLEALLGEPANRMYSEMERSLRGHEGCQLHYVTAREMFNVAKAAEAGETGNPNQYRDYVIPPYRNRFAQGKAYSCAELQVS